MFTCSTGTIPFKSCIVIVTSDFSLTFGRKKSVILNNAFTLPSLALTKKTFIFFWNK